MPRPETTSFADAYEDHVARIFGFFAYRTRSRAEAEDLTQATFERALRAWERYDPRRALVQTWLLTIARNLLIDHYRADRTDVQETYEAEAHDPSVEGPESQLGLAPELAAALERLSSRDREVIALRFGADLNGPEIAKVTGLSVANVQQILSRSLRRLRDELDGAPTGA